MFSVWFEFLSDTNHGIVIFCCFSSAFSHKCWYSTSNYGTLNSINIILNLLSSSHLYYEVSVTELLKVKGTNSKIHVTFCQEHEHVDVLILSTPILYKISNVN
jgi:hypothetical protein